MFRRVIKSGPDLCGVLFFFGAKQPVAFVLADESEVSAIMDQIKWLDTKGEVLELRGRILLGDGKAERFVGTYRHRVGSGLFDSMGVPDDQAVALR